ncbi:histidine phosphatase superfamily [Sordaria brevicollis]|uniref:Histidine phosphatase superfamily n=1 Tax=Sordaria brevicollis TaxID=83679 RepID=A0AAE0UAM1_SORBR|nr:histidine phosphatase superfamily [Sordaria brevicollis]
MKGIISTTLAASMLVGTAFPQKSPIPKDDSTEERVWSSVAWVMHGDRTPLGVPGSPPTLTPHGAQQMLARGSVLRNRYIVAPLEPASFDFSKLIGARLVGLSTNAIDNTQLDVVAAAESYNFHSALALMQGLYPPSTKVFNGTDGIAAALMADTNILDYPLEGYQYPVIRSPSGDDPESVVVDANQLCPQYLHSLDSFEDNSQVKKTYNQTLVFYKAEWERLFHGDNIQYPVELADYHHAYGFYDHIQYLYTHDNATQRQLNSSFVAYLENLAASEQREKHGNLTVSGKEEGDKIRAVAGRTMAGKVMKWFDNNIQAGGQTNKLNMAFTSIEPFFAFFSLSGLVDGPSAEQFKSHVPNPSAAMIFELFSKASGSGSSDDSDFPSDEEDLWVRFLYDNGKPGSLPTEYALFGNGNSQSVMSLKDFRHSMGQIALNSSENWCDTCDSPASFCLVTKYNPGDNDNNSGGSHHSNDPVISDNKTNPFIAGAIGAASAIAAIGLGFLAATLLGLRFHRAGSEKRREQERMFRMLNLGSGYKPRAPDADVTFARNGVRHERVGSWEMHNGFGNNPYATSNTGSAGAGLNRVYTGGDGGYYSSRAGGGGSSSKKMSEDDGLGGKPVKPRDFTA